jgi:plasmid stability protein
VLSMLAFLYGKSYHYVSTYSWFSIMAQLIVRDLPPELVVALKQRAAKRNRSAEQEHREILKAVLNGPKRRSLATVLASIPDVGEDSDFVREQRDRRD